MDTNGHSDPSSAPAVLYIPDLMRELRVGERVARGIARQIGRKVGGRRWGVLRSELVSYLLRRDGGSR